MESTPQESGSFFRELKRRKVTRTCIVYVLVCWGALQVGDILFPALGFDPDVGSRYFLYLAVAGFPATFALAWFFQITPQGIVRTTSFVERRVLSNIPPVNDRRSGSVTHYFRKGDSQPGYQWVLTAETGPLSGLSFGVTQDVVLGRSLECELAVVSPHVSRQHARLSLEDDQLYVTDLGSSNGTVVNGRTIKDRQALRNEDELRFHDIIFRVSEMFSAKRHEMDAANKTTFIQAPVIDENPKA